MQISELRFGDVGRGLGHYRPVAAATVAIVAMGLTLPGPARVTGNFFDDTFGAPSGMASVATPAAAVPEAEATGEVAAAVSAIESSPSSFSDFSSSYSAPTTSAETSSFTVDATATRSDTTSTTASSPDVRTAPPRPLTVAASGWSSAQAGTPLASTGVPEGALPIGRRPGFSEDKVSFIRLTGTATTLTLKAHDDASGTRSAEAAQIRVCRITTPGWAGGTAMAAADAPKWDCAVSVLGARGQDGSWTFDLSVFEDRADERGFALVPDGTTVDFQVALKPA